MKFEDSALTCAGAQNAATDLATSTFAIVGSWADFDNCEVPVFKANPSLVQVGYPLTNDFRVTPNVFTPRPSPAGFWPWAAIARAPCQSPRLAASKARMNRS